MSTRPSATTRVVAYRRPDGFAAVDLRTGALTPRILTHGRDRVRIALMPTTALLLAGDHVEIEVGVHDGVVLDVVETAGTVAYDMRGGGATWQVHADVQAESGLCWHSLPFVVSDGATVERRTGMTLAAAARLSWRETVVLGRSGQRGGVLALDTRADCDATPLLRETMVLDPASRDDPLVLGGARVLDTLTVIGHPVDVDEGDGLVALRLPDGSRQLRWLGTSLHLSPLNHFQMELPDRLVGETAGK